MRYNFKDKQEFEKLEDLAIDGQLDYSEFKPAEYKFFSQLARLGYLNRHSGWSKELCEMKQKEFRADYYAACAERNAWYEHAKTVQQRLVKIGGQRKKLNTAKTKGQALSAALKLLESLTEEPGLFERLAEKFELKELK